MQMKKYFLILMLLISGVSFSQNLSYPKIKDECKCIKKKGYWYNDKCWKKFEQFGIRDNQIDSMVSESIQAINSSRMKWGNQEFPIIEFFVMNEGNKMLALVIFELENKDHTMMFLLPKKAPKKKGSTTRFKLYEGNFMQNEEERDSIPKAKGEANVQVINEENAEFNFNGKLNFKNDTINFSFNTNDDIVGAGGSELRIVGNEAFLKGDLGTITYHQIKNLIENHPEVKTLVLTTISGSVNDEVNMHTGRLVHEAGLNTKVLKNSDIASGAVDLFCAGKERIIEEGAKLGIHSWCCLDDLKANEIPKDHPAHKYQIEYFTMCLGVDLGPKFYFHTLTSANFDDIHWMTIEEMKKWKIGTQYLK